MSRIPHQARLHPDQIASLARRVQARRIALNLSCKEAAQRCGVGHATWLDLERQDISASPQTIARIAAGLGLDLSAYL